MKKCSNRRITPGKPKNGAPGDLPLRRWELNQIQPCLAKVRAISAQQVVRSLLDGYRLGLPTLKDARWDHCTTPCLNDSSSRSSLTRNALLPPRTT